MDSVAILLERTLGSGVRLWAEAGQLRYKSPKGALSAEEVSELAAAKAALIHRLERFSTMPVELAAEQAGWASLSYSQLAHWNTYQLHRAVAIRQVAAVRRLRGPLQVSALEASLAQLAHRHAALRTRIELIGGVPVQKTLPTPPATLQIEDIGSDPDATSERRLQEMIRKVIMEPVRLATDALYAVKLVRLGAEEHVLIIALEHMIADAASLGVLLNELFAFYAALQSDRLPSIGPAGMQFPDYARALRRGRRSWLSTHGTYWQEHLRGCERVYFPSRCGTATGSHWAMTAFQIEPERKTRLEAWARQRRTTLPLAVFTAYAAAAMRWCHVSQMVFPYQTDGRLSPEVRATVGYFACNLHLRVALGKEDSFIDLLDRIIAEYCQAFEHHDLGYIEAQLPVVGCVSNAGFNWVPASAANRDSELQVTERLTVHPCVQYEHPLLDRLDRDSEPMALLIDTGAQIAGEFYYSRSRLDRSSAQTFLTTFVTFIDRLLDDPAAAVPDLTS